MGKPRLSAVLSCTRVSDFKDSYLGTRRRSLLQETAELFAAGSMKRSREALLGSVLSGGLVA